MSACIVFQVGSWLLGDTSTNHMLIAVILASLYLAGMIFSLKLIAQKNKFFTKVLKINFSTQFELSPQLATSCSSGCSSAACGSKPSYQSKK